MLVSGHGIFMIVCNSSRGAAFIVFHFKKYARVFGKKRLNDYLRRAYG